MTKILIALFAGLSILRALLAMWLRTFDPAEWLAMVPGRVLVGEVWRLVSYPWIAGGVFDLLIGVLMLVVFAGAMEDRWGERVFLRRLAWLVVVPPVATTLLSLVVTPLQGGADLGMRALLVSFIVAFASQLRNRQVMLFPLPFALSGDGLLWLEGGILALMILFSGSILPFMTEIFAFAFALAWFRLDSFKGMRRSWLQFRKRRIEQSMAQMRRNRSLRVVRDEDDDENSNRYLH